MTQRGYEQVCAALGLQYANLVAAFAELDPAGPTDCAGWTVADLETHLALTARSLARIAVEPVDGRADGGGVAQWSQRIKEFADEVDRMTKTERLSLAPQAKAATQALAEHPADQVVEQLTGRHTLRDAAMFRLIETVVHGLDANVPPAPQAVKLVVKELAAALAQRYPGKSVEVRVPPYAAVQCLGGPRHTRGTPPNTVEAEPIAFVRLCAGRERWSDLIKDGRVRASGERSDLSSLLPLLG